MTLLEEVREAADEGRPITDALRRCAILAERLKSEEVQMWVEQELHGYTGTIPVPAYRKIPALDSRASFRLPTGAKVEAVAIPFDTIPADLHPRLTNKHLLESIVEYEAAFRHHDVDFLKIPWRPDWYARLNEGVVAGGVCVAAWQEYPVENFGTIVGTVRARIVRFADAIESLNPEASEAMANETPIAPEMVAEIFGATLRP